MCLGTDAKSQQSCVCVLHVGILSGGIVPFILNLDGVVSFKLSSVHPREKAFITQRSRCGPPSPSGRFAEEILTTDKCLAAIFLRQSVRTLVTMQTKLSWLIWETDLRFPSQDVAIVVLEVSLCDAGQFGQRRTMTVACGAVHCGNRWEGLIRLSSHPHVSAAEIKDVSGCT